MQQIKVTDTKMHKTVTAKDGRYVAKVPVAEGKFILVECNMKTGDGIIYLSHEKTSYKPIIISETERIEVGDWILLLDSFGNPFLSPQQWKGEGVLTRDHKKILVFSEQFSPKQLQMIVDGKIKDGDKVLVECELKEIDCPDGIEGCEVFHQTQLIRLNSSNHITLHKVEEKMYAREEVLKIIKAYNISNDPYARLSDKKTMEWFEQNVK